VSLLPLAWEVKLLFLRLAPKIMARRRELARVVEEMGRGKGGILVLYNDKGEEVRIWAGMSEDGKPEVDIENAGRRRANNEIVMHYSTFKAIVEGKLDPRVAYAHDLIYVRSLDGLPVSFHALLWFSWFDLVKEEIEGLRAKS